MNDANSAEKDLELAFRADSLMDRASRPQSLEDRNIPVLTDFVEELPTAASAATQDAATALLQSMGDDEIDMLSHDIFQRVTERMDRELASKLEARLSQEINAKVRVAVANVLIDMRQTIANEIGDAVNAALADRLRR